jgi:hypothetical protein
MKALAIQCHNDIQKKATISLFKKLGYCLRNQNQFDNQKYFSGIRAITLRNDISLGGKYEIMRSGGRFDDDMLDCTSFPHFAFKINSILQANAAIAFFKTLGYRVHPRSILRETNHIGNFIIIDNFKIITVDCLTHYTKNFIIIDLNNVKDFTREKEMPKHALSNMAFYCANKEEFRRLLIWISKTHPDSILDDSVIREADGAKHIGTHSYLALNMSNKVALFMRIGVKDKMIIPVSRIENLPDLKVKVGEYEVDQWAGGIKVGCYEITLDKIQEVLSVIGMEARTKEEYITR